MAGGGEKGVTPKQNGHLRGVVEGLWSPGVGEGPLKERGLGQGAAAGPVGGVGALRAGPCSPRFSFPVAAADDVWLGARVVAVPRTARRARPPPRASLGVPAHRTSSLPSLHPTPSRPPSPLLASHPRTRGGRAAGGGWGSPQLLEGGRKLGAAAPKGEKLWGEREGSYCLL